MRQGFQPLSDWEFDLKLTPMDIIVPLQPCRESPNVICSRHIYDRFRKLAFLPLFEGF
jgi:hypothetical protein